MFKLEKKKLEKRNKKIMKKMLKNSEENNR